ncbi:MAG TPA: glycerophosphodiester phosphodiesterase family protein [Nitrospira sp.]|nr:glycerophosphodiester phosphodiesterase family protein [Nitrospira sp.]
MNRISTLILTIVASGVVVLLGGLFTLWLLALPSKGEALAHDAGLAHPTLLAHRGASYLAPEETRPAYLMARELGVDYLELDLQRTRDGILVAIHDDILSRTSNIDEVFPERKGDSVDTFTFAELQQLDIGDWFNRAFPERARKSFHGLRVLRLQEILEIAEATSPRIGLCIETKRAHRFSGIERQLVEELRGREWIQHQGAPGRASLIFQSFDPDSLERLKVLAPEISRLLLVDEALLKRLAWEGVLRVAERLATGIGPWGYGWAFGPEWSSGVGRRYVPTWPWYTRAAHQAGLIVFPWTIDDRWEMWMVRLAGADGIFTNRGELAMEVFGRSPRPDIEALWQKIGY